MFFYVPVILFTLIFLLFILLLVVTVTFLIMFFLFRKSLETSTNLVQLRWGLPARTLLRDLRRPTPARRANSSRAVADR